jgi:hypothetical protein
MSSIGDRLKQRYEDNRQAKLVTKSDLKALRRDMDRNMKRMGSGGTGTRQAAGQAIRMVKRGFDNIGKSLNTPYDVRRPQISQLPARRRDIGISVGMNLDRLKANSLRGQNINGKVGKKKKLGI